METWSSSHMGGFRIMISVAAILQLLIVSSHAVTSIRLSENEKKYPSSHQQVEFDVTETPGPDHESDSENSIDMERSALAYAHKEVENPLQFAYSGAKGPDKWGSLNPKFSLCADGKSQSPIDIVTKHAVTNKKLNPLIREYNPSSNVTLVDYKFTVGIEYPEHMGEITVYGKRYELKQMHWHSPSEHRINGKRFAAELHMVHVASDGNVSVVATLFNLGQPDPVIGKIYNKLNEMGYKVKSNEAAAPISVYEAFPPEELRKTPRKYYIYTGSFSAPPCTENIIYLVLAKARSISSEQVLALKAPLDSECKYNARPCQPINGRRVHVYKQDYHKN